VGFVRGRHSGAIIARREDAPACASVRE
jgi:hypothetical protein